MKNIYKKKRKKQKMLWLCNQTTFRGGVKSLCSCDGSLQQLGAAAAAPQLCLSQSGLFL